MILRSLFQNDFKNLITKIVNKMKGKEHWNYSIKGILSDNKHMNPFTLMDRFERYKRVLKSSGIDDCEGFNFENKTIFKLGSGPYLDLILT